MKVFNCKKLKTFLLSGLAVLSVTFGALLYTSLTQPIKASADSIASTVYQTDGASVRVFKKDSDGSLTDTDRKGIRFHVETGADYQIADGLKLLDTTQTNEENGSFKLAEGYKTYTLIIPTRLMGSSTDLTMQQEHVMAIDTSKYWYADESGNWESVAYIYSVPEKWYTDQFTYRGIICSVDANGNETPVKWTPMATRSLAEVAKNAYLATIDENTNYWGTADLDNEAAPKIKAFVPTYNVTYSNGDTEEVLWGDKLTKVDTQKTYYDETNHEPIDVTLPLNMSTNCDVHLETTEESTFVLTGVDYMPTGFKVFATLPTDHFGHDVELEPSTIDMVTGAGNVVKATSVTVHVTGAGDDAISQLVIEFDYTNISNGTTLTILKTSHFYNDGIFYELEKDYEFIYNNNTWELPLGQITLGDIENIKNYSEIGANGIEEHNIRITFKKDILINGGATFTNGSVAITRFVGGAVENISDGYYYWNQGDFMILEIPGSVDIWGEENGDVLTIAAGTRLVQNNGFYVFQDEIKATFNGSEDWNFSYTEHEIDASAFTAAYTRQSADSIYIDVYTAEQWVDHHVKVVCNDGTLTYHHSDNVSTVDPNQIFYHGENGNSILRIHIDKFSITGDWVTIPAETAFWVGDQIYKLTEDVISYFVATGSDGMTWITNPVIKEAGIANIQSMGWYQGNVRYTTTETWSTAANNRVIIDDTYIEGDGVEIIGSNYTGFYYYGGANRILEVQGTNFSEAGGSVTLKKGVIIWLFDNAGAAYCGAYHLTEDLTVEISGAAGSPMYKDIAVASVGKADVASVANDGSHQGEIRFNLNSLKVTGMYGEASVEGSATLEGEATTSAFVYGGDGTSGYTGNTIIAFTGKSFGRAFQASKVGDVVSIAAGTKVWLSNGSGYIVINDTLNYVYNGSSYVDADVQRTVTFNSPDATVKVNGEAVTSLTVATGEIVNFAVELPAGYEIVSVNNATLIGGQSYTTGNLFADVTVTVTCAAPIKISQADVTHFAKEGDGEIRIGLNKDRADISAITGHNNNIAFNGTVELIIGGNSVQPTQYNYYGLISGTNHQLLGINCDAGSMVGGDSITIKGGSTFKFGNTVLLVESDIVGKMLGVTANFNSDLATLSIDGTGLVNGVEVPKFVGSGSSTITFGWKMIGDSDVRYDSMYNLTSVKINGVEKGVSGTYTIELSGDVVIDVTTEAKKTYTVTATTSGGVTVSNTPQTVVEGGSVTFNLTVPTNATIKANGAQISGNTYTVSNVTANTTVAFTTWYTVSVTSLSNASVKVDGTSRAKGWSELRESGTSITVQASYTEDNDRSLKVGSSSWNDTAAHTVTITGKTDISASSSNGCFAEGTMIMLADGTTKAVEDLQVGDELLVFNHETGEWDTAPMFLMAHDELPRQMWNVMNLRFSNGNTLRIVWQHGLFNKTLNQYVYVSEKNVNDFIGHEFASVSYINGVATTEYVTLESVVITEEYIKVYTPDSAYHLNVVAEDMLAITPFVIPNLFAFDENMKYDEEQMQADIEQYGLYTYEDFAEYITEEEFELFPFAYYKVAVGKGLITYDEIIAVVQTFYLQ